MKANKYNYLKVIQQNYSSSYGWEDVSEYNTDSTGYMNKGDREVFKADLREYKTLGYPTRVIKRRELAN